MARKYTRKMTREELREMLNSLKFNEHLVLKYQSRDRKVEGVPQSTTTLFAVIEKGIVWSNEKQEWEDRGYRTKDWCVSSKFKETLKSDEECKRAFSRKIFGNRECVDAETMINACEKLGFTRG